MKILLTGSSSFIGVHFRRLVEGLGHEVIGWDLLTYLLQDRRIDLAKDDLEWLFPDDVDVVVHLAALSRDQDCKDRLAETLAVNVHASLSSMKLRFGAGQSSLFSHHLNGCMGKMQEGVRWSRTSRSIQFP